MFLSIETFIKGAAMNMRIQLNEKEIPRQWYNLSADLPSPLQPPLGPDGNPVSPDMIGGSIFRKRY